MSPESYRSRSATHDRLVIATLIHAFRRATKGFKESADAENCSEIEVFSGDVVPSHLSRVAGREL